MNTPKPVTRLGRRLTSLRRARAPAPEPPAGFPVVATDVEVLDGPWAFRVRLLQAIARARRRIVLVALYLEDDDAGREVMDALYDAHAAHPTLQIEVYVDWHRAQRGLIGKQASAGNAAMYRDYAARRGSGVVIRGVPVQNREVFGVLHLKGFIIDDSVIYSGASLNNVYLARHDRYRLDRYHVIRHAGLADCMADFVARHLGQSAATGPLDRVGVPRRRELSGAIRDLRQQLRQARYDVPTHAADSGSIEIAPLLGFGRAHNQLNDTVLSLLRGARQRVILFTPYFNLPRPVRLVIGQLLRRGCRLEIMVGDKQANDFYIPPDQPFRRIGLLPYLYESNLRRFARAHRKHIASGQLNLWLWRHGNNSFHLKGLYVDATDAVLTGNNLNPRAWSLDLENGLWLRDPQQLLATRHESEWQTLCRHANRIRDFRDIESTRQYPPEVRRLLRRLTRTRLDQLLNRLL